MSLIWLFNESENHYKESLYISLTAQEKPLTNTTKTKNKSPRITTKKNNSNIFQSNSSAFLKPGSKSGLFSTYAKLL